MGLSFDARTNYIFAAGGPTGKAYVYDASTGALVQEYTLTAATGTFINDVIVTRDAAYFTDYYRRSTTGSRWSGWPPRGA